MRENPPTGCTIGPRAVTGERCGKPAVTTFTGRDGKVYAECLEHAVTFTPTAKVAPGDDVAVFHVGLRKLGVVVTVGRVNCRVMVPLARGGEKLITVPMAEVTVLGEAVL